MAAKDRTKGGGRGELERSYMHRVPARSLRRRGATVTAASRERGVAVKLRSGK